MHKGGVVLAFCTSRAHFVQCSTFVLQLLELEKKTKKAFYFFLVRVIRLEEACLEISTLCLFFRQGIKGATHVENLVQNVDLKRAVFFQSVDERSTIVES